MDRREYSWRPSVGGDEYVLSGRKLFVPDAHVADYAIVAARTSEGADGKRGDYRCS